MTVSKAWLLNCGTSLSLAVGDHEMLEYLQPQPRYRVPGSPAYCSSVVYWQNNFVPVMDVAVLHGQNSDHENASLSVVAYQSAPMQPLQHLVIPINTAPEKIDVGDDQACEISEEIELSLLKSISLSCFMHANHPVLIVDMAKLCSAEFRDYVDDFVNITA